MTGASSLVFAVSACVLLTGSTALGRHQDHELTGIRGLPVEGHDIVAGVEIIGTKLDIQKFRERLRSHGADLRLGLPLESQTLCRFREVLRDVLSERGFFDADITHETAPTYGNPRHLTVKFTVAEGKRSRRLRQTAPALSPAERCLR